MPILLNCLYLLLAIFYLPNLILKGKHRAGFKQRLGFYSQKIKDKVKIQRPFVWIHAVSVGEIKAAQGIISSFKEKSPEKRILISTVTSTGNALACQLACENDLVIYFPFDLTWIIKKTLKFFQPRLILIMETELWPNLFIYAARKRIPVVIVNGRISDQSFPLYRAAAFIFGLVLKNVALFCMQTELDSQRIIHIGAQSDKVKVIGNLKFDAKEKNIRSDCKVIRFIKQQEKSNFIVAGSTHKKEEEIFVRVFTRLKLKYPHLCLLLAPRHPQRAEEIRSITKKYAQSVLISEIKKREIILSPDKILILDVMGILNKIYEFADIVLIGGSFVPFGGHNPIEAAVYGKPIIFGKYMFNFAQIAEIFLSHNASICADSENELYKHLDSLLCNAFKRQQLCKQAKDVVLKNKGAAQRLMRFLEHYRLLPADYAQTE